MNRQFTEEETQMANILHNLLVGTASQNLSEMEFSSCHIVHKEKKREETRRKEADNTRSKRRQGCAESGNSLHYW